MKFIDETCKFRYTKEQSHSRFDDDVRGDSLPLPFLSRNIVYVILQTWNLGASFSICGKLRFIDFPPPFIFPSLPGLPSFPPSSFSRVHPENSTLDHGYSTVASFLSTAHSAKSRLSVLFGRRVMLVILRIDRFSSHDRVEFAIRNVPFFLPPPLPLLLLSLSLSLLANRWKRNRLCGKEKLHYQWWIRGSSKKRYSLLFS